jgi:hypothetical protein
MKKILVIIASLLLTASVQANTYTDNNPADVLLTALDPSYTGQFTLAGYNPAAETITSANAEFSFGGIGLDSFTITMGADSLSHGSFFGILNVGTSTALNAWGILDSTGVLSYTVSLTANSPWESLLLTNANLTAETASRSVPDSGATAILLGLGVIGILGAKRRFASVA